MRNSLWNKRIPSLLGIFLLLIGVGLTSYFLQFQTLLTSRAAPGNTPQHVRITNISDSGFTVSYLTTDIVNGSLSFGNDKNLGKVILDDRDKQSGNPASYQTHSLSLTSLQPATTYYFSIISGSNTYLKDAEPYSITTAPKITGQPNAQSPLAGNIATKDGQPAKNTLVYVTTNNSQTLSTLTKDDGSYLLPLNLVRDSGLKTLVPIDENSLLKVFALNLDDSSQATLKASQVNPVPLITLSKNYDFTSNNSETTASSSAETSFPSFNSTEVAESAPSITIPKKDERFSDLQPTFTGTGVTGETVAIEINPNAITDTTSVSKTSWKYRPLKPLSIGNHTLTISTKDKSGTVKKLTQSFVILAPGSKSIEPSVSPSALPTPTSKPSPSPTPSPTLAPTATVAPTIIVTTPTQAIQPTTPPVVTLPATGSSDSIALTAVGIAMLGVGMLLFVMHKI